MSFKNLQAHEALAWLESDQALFVDIRDPQSYAAGHIRGALALNNDNVAQFVREQDKTRPVVVCCYHGMSSQNAAQFLFEQGFSEAYSLAGGYEQWKHLYPEQCTA
ncbi:thiosulfate sulfurtransferase GlpE [Marinospirillum sp. MEB164]|uniref:Thiosulfate sulfurtransferase GlpE n=1 Tax=Marinospirillum alkalitolerans TaxID=3123374 RepID=A0ABW8PW15_9GAMM